MNNAWLEVILIFLLIILNGVFAMAELALVSARKVRLQQRADDGDRGARAAIELAEDPNRLLSTVQVGITLVGILVGAVGGATVAERLAEQLNDVPWLADIASGLALAIVVLLSTYFSLVIGELIPKRLAMNNPEKVATALSQPMRVLAVITTPVIKLLSWSTNAGLRILGTRPNEEPSVTEEEIKVMIEQGGQVGLFGEAEQDMVEGVMRLGDQSIDAIMTPRTEIEWIDLDEPFEVIRSQIIASQHTRFPVAQSSLDNVIGILQVRDFLARCLDDGPVDIEAMLQPPLFIPDSMSALKVVEMIKESGVQVALVIDEYGGLLGMVTLLDILEGIVGVLPTGPGEEVETQAIQREDGSWLLGGLIQVDEFKELFNLDELPEEARLGYQTLAGFIFSHLETIPVAGQHFEWNGLRFEIMDMDGRRVDKVLVSRTPPDENNKEAEKS